MIGESAPEYGNGLNAGILRVVHAITAHEIMFSDNHLSTQLNWRHNQAGLSIMPALWQTKRAGVIEISEASLAMDGGDTRLDVYNPRLYGTHRAFDDDDRYADMFLGAFQAYYDRHVQDEHAACIERMETLEQLRQGPVPRLRSGYTGETIIP